MKQRCFRCCVFVGLLLLGGRPVLAEQETLPPLIDGKVPSNFEELWRGFDPRAEPLEVEVLDEMEQDGIVIKIVRFRIGFFNGKRAMMAAVYGYPKGGENLPGLVHIHGGGQYAHWQPVYTLAKRGYAVLSIAWAGRYEAPGIKVGPDEVKQFWEGTGERLTTDWGGIDAYHAPCRFKGNNFVLNPPSDSSLDSVKSPRNSGWFGVAMGARRALTFLERQPEVDGDRLGVFGHSMGGKLTVMTAGSDRRVKAAVPSCGGVTDRSKPTNLPEFSSTICDDVYLKRISCPIAFQIPSNDFHSEINDLQDALGEIKSEEWRVTCSPHQNHTDTAEYYALTHLWFDRYLKDGKALMQTPQTDLVLKTESGIPTFTVKPDHPGEVQQLNVWYTEQGKIGDRHNIDHVKNKFWKYAAAKKEGDVWMAELPTFGNDANLWVYANVNYALPEPIAGVGYGYEAYTAESYTLSSRMAMVTPEQKQQAGVKATLKHTLTIEDFKGDWRKEWYAFVDEPNRWEMKTHKVYSPVHQPPLGAKLVFDVRSEEVNHLAINVGKTWKVVGVKGGNQWQEVSLLPSDMNAHDPADGLVDWQDIRDLKLSGSDWKGPRPDFRNLHWVKIPLKEMWTKREVKLTGVEPVDEKIYLDLKDADIATGTWKLQMNSWVGSDAPFTHGGKTFEQGISLIAPSEINFFLGGKYKKFHTTVLTGHTASVGIEIYLDRNLVYQKASMETGAAHDIDLILKDACELKLIVTDGGNGATGDSVTWADTWVQ